MSRSLMTLPFGERRLVGTAHLPEAGAARVGFLLLNPGPAPRSGNSDLSARLGDRVAARGGAVFRFDLPGLGDSEGELPERIPQFWREVQRGRNDGAALELGRRLRSGFGLRRLFVGGLCAGAITSMRAADADPGAFDGLLLLEPSFKLDAEFVPKVAEDPLKRALRVLAGLRPLRPLLSRCLGEILPRDADAELVATWRRVIARRRPIFLAMASARGREHLCQRLLATTPSYRRRFLTELAVEGCNHIFTWGDSLEAVLEAATRWADGHLRPEPN